MTTWLHDPDDFLDYTFNVDGLADGEAVADATAVGDDGITVSSVSNTDTSVTWWVTGGEPGTTYSVVVHIVTDQGREADQTARFRCRQR